MTDLKSSSAQEQPSPGQQIRQLADAGTIAIPGAFNAAVARLIERAGFPAAYVSGAALANGVAAVPDIGLLTLTEVVSQARYVAQAVSIPVLADADTGFGAAINVWRAIREFEAAGIAGVHIEDQEMPKRCGHLAGKRLIAPAEMAQRIGAAVRARRDPGFVIIARVDSRSVAGLDDAIARGKRYREAGADAIFPEGLESADEFRAFADSVGGVLLANMTEFGKTPLLSVSDFASLGYRIVIFPMTLFRIMMKAVEGSLAELKESGTQRGLLPRMQTREELYDLVRYPDYVRLDEQIAGFDSSLGDSPRPRRQDPML
jgi:methylisocitrate lyase